MRFYFVGPKILQQDLLMEKKRGTVETKPESFYELEDEV
jgi:hypothetical protein